MKIIHNDLEEAIMGVRLTGISTPMGGVSWEYTNKAEKDSVPLLICPGQKIKVFISSICGVERYDKVRSKLKSSIEATQLADVYLFEEAGAASLTYINLQSSMEMKKKLKASKIRIPKF